MTTKRFDPIRDKSAEIIDYIMEAPEMPDDEALLFKIRLSIEEVVENIVSYAYEDGAGSMDVEISKGNTDFMLTIRLIDEGVAFNPLEAPDPDLSLSAEERPIGGLGIFLCKQMMDQVSYSYENGCNVLTMSKHVSA